MDINTELRRTDPDYVVYVPKSMDGSTNDTGNEHFRVGIGPRPRIDLGVYPSITNRGGNDVLWHPDRKFFLVGKRITSEWLSGLTVPV